MAFEHAAHASVFVVSIYGMLHTILAAVFALFGNWRIMNGYVSSKRTLDLRIGLLWHKYTALAGTIALTFPALLSLLKTTAGGA